MDFNEISNLFGGSIFAEEYRGDFRQIETSIQKIERSQSRHTLQGLARQCLLRAIFETLRGEYGQSQVYFDEIFEHEASLDDRWKGRLRLYERLNLISRLMLPAVRFRSNLGGSASTIHDCRLGAQSQIATPIPMYTMTSTIDMCEFQVLQALYYSYVATWISACLHPQFAHAGLKGSAEEKKALLRETPPDEILNMLATSGLAPTLGYFTRLKCETNPQDTQAEPTVAFANSYHLYQKDHDLVGLANYHIILGDRTVSPPFTNPLALNMILEGQPLGWANEEWDKVEASFHLTGRKEADIHYSNALTLVNSIAAPRVRGAISLRRACILHMTALQVLFKGNQEDADALFSDAAVHLYSAEDDFSWDESHLQLVACHKLLLDISRGDHQLLENRAAEIGLWGKTSENTALAQLLGFMMMRFGRRIFVDQARADLAQLCIDCAKALFEALVDEVYLLQSELADAQLKHQCGNFAAAQVVIDTIRQKNRAFSSLQELSSRSANNARVLGLPIFNLLTGCNRIVSTIYGSSNDANAIDTWRDEYRKLKKELQITRTIAASQLFSAATGRQVNMEELLEETEAACELKDLYDDYMTQGLAKLDQSDVEGFDRCIKEYLEKSARIPRAADIWLTHNIVAHTSLNNYERARQLLPHAIASTFGGCANSLVDSELREVQFEALSISNKVKIDFNAAERAISLCYLSHDWTRGLDVLLQVERAFPSELNSDHPNITRTEWKFGVYVAAIWEHNGNVGKAFSWYLWSYNSLQTQRRHVEDPDARRGMGWSIHNSNLFAGLTRVALKFWRGQTTTYSGRKCPSDWGLTAPDWLAQALVFTEDSFARTLLELIVTNDEASVEDLDRWSATSFLNRQINDLKSVERTARKDLTSLEQEHSSANRQQRNDLSRRLQEKRRDVDRIEKSIEQYEHDLEELHGQGKGTELSMSLSNASRALMSATQSRLDIPAIFTAVAPDTAVIELNSSRGGLIILGITKRGVEVVHETSTNELELRRMVFPYVRALRNKGVGIKETSLSNELARLSELVLGLLDELLSRVEHVVFVPSSTFMSFPFGCLLYHNEPLILRKAVSQVPSLAVLERLVRLGEKRTESNTGASKLFTVVNSHQRTNSEAAPVVLGAFGLHRLFGTPPFAAEAVDEIKFATEYRDATIVHVGTHGYQSALSPWQSYLSLAKQFKVMEIAKLKTHAALVVFCACLSGIGKSTNGNDVLGFSHAVLQSGAQVYMGALWNVSQVETSMLMTLFYRKIVEQEGRISIAKAWQYAQITFYNMSKEEGLRYLEEMMTDWDYAERTGIPVGSFLQGGKRTLEIPIEKKKKEWGEKPFKNPYFWASFSLIGHAGLSLRWSSDSGVSGR